jgi:hypothetical protein
MQKKDILKNIVKKVSGQGGPIGPFDPYKKTMVPLPSYITTGTPTPSYSTSINYNAREDNDGKARRAVSNVRKVDETPKKEKANKYVGTKDDNQRLRNAHTEIISRALKTKNNSNNKVINLNATAGSFNGQNEQK